jgi:hypothetical protein
MKGEKWAQVRTVLSQIGNEAMQYDADGIDICFLNSPLRKESITVSVLFSSCFLSLLTPLL